MENNSVPKNTPMIDIIINSTFTGIGTAIGLTLFEYFIKPRIKSIHKKVTHIRNKLR